MSQKDTYKCYSHELLNIIHNKLANKNITKLNLSLEYNTDSQLEKLVKYLSNNDELTDLHLIVDKMCTSKIVTFL